MVAHANAVIDPRAVMVEPFNTHVAYGAVFRPWSAYDLTVGTHLAGVDFAQEIHEGELGLETTWVLEGSSYEWTSKDEWERWYRVGEKFELLIWKERWTCFKRCDDLLGIIMKIWEKIRMMNNVANSTYVLWFFLSLTIGVFTMKHSMYFGSFNMLTKSIFIYCGKSSFTIYMLVNPVLLTGDLLAPLIRSARTGLVVFSSGTLLIARCKAVKPD